jgi:predicted aspartyl protease
MRSTTTSLTFLLGGTLAFGQGPAFEPVTVPLLDDDVAFRVPVAVSGQTNYFLVDTGTSATALDVRFRERLGEAVRQWDGHDFYRSPELVLGKARLAVHEVFCTDLKMFGLITGEPYDGIFGMDLLKNHVVELDFDRGVVVISKEVPAQARTNAWRIPMRLSNKRHFLVPTLINGKVTLDLLLDTADSSTLSFKQEDWDLVFPPGENAAMHKVLLAGINKNVTESTLARLASVEVQSRKYSNVVCMLSLYETAPSALGMGFFRRHHVTFDFPNETLYLRPGRRFNAAEEHDMSGLHLLRRDSGTFVQSVDEGSPALLAGIQAGDVIRSINARKCAEMKMKEVRQLLKGKPGDKVSLEIERSGNIVKMIFVLKRVL